jgi:hypothetical protein
MKFDGLLDRLSPIGRLATDFPGGPEGEKAAYRISQSFVVVNDQYAQSRHGACRLFAGFSIYELAQWENRVKSAKSWLLISLLWNYRRWRVEKESKGRREIMHWHGRATESAREWRE